MKALSLMFLLALVCTPSLATQENKQLTQRTQELKAVEQRIAKETKKLQKNAHKREALLGLLAKTEKAIGQLSEEKAVEQQQLDELQKGYQNKKAAHSKLERDYLSSIEQFKKTIRLRYATRISPLMKYLLSPQSVHTNNENIQYYNYLLKNQKTQIERLYRLHTAVQKSTQALQGALEEQQLVAQSLQEKVHALAQKKKQQTKLLQNVFQDIKNNKTRMAQYQSDRQNLSTLIHKLRKAHQSVKQQPFAKMRHKLKLPAGNEQSKKTVRNRGVIIYAPEGTAVQAVHSGKVVFSDWLRGYGLLLILDHGAGYMTLYAHNLSLKKKVGDDILQGETIAQVGHSGGVRENGLYFEIRYRGKAIATRGWFS